ncbi:hypothetical protein ACKKBG_A30680 [Auxenochlorella protothecoides x Auxenochlorella symbiontica]|uniref:ADP-ribosylation factor-related protein 1 n=1 Tax=Auxenochlorella protothecoides TaxID=3075 RepID=A0A087SRU5_AUXPR|nr:ADP-ribosylation factor-related protein 1 [Auxenochlorella protothecoides]KFM28449.1 ADP-ribosylation factor-related protein 1 [Auxenochlorella protothecoides]RMZ53335.1 hypothetical protein APUTEX25_004823 [Auxenochlorella protothecoides]|eukprot:RMZ53335.1 hypothetical protein APUTEX25_004823 [Auxenochlorella protothecoides]
MAYSLISGFYDWWTHREPVRLLLIGIDDAGKTSVLEALKAACDPSAGSVAPAAIQPTVGLNIGSLDLAGSPVTVWDLGGAPGLRRIWTEYYGEAHAVVMVVDASTPSRFQESKHALDSALGTQELFDAPLLLLVHKQDANGACSPEEVAAALGVHAGGEGRLCHVAGTATNDPMGVKNAFSWAVKVSLTGPRATLLASRG